MNTSSDGLEILQELARVARVSHQWHDHRGELRTVAPDVLRTVLEALDLPAGTPEQCQESLEHIQITEQRRIPSLTTGRSSEKLILPAALQNALTVNDVVQLHRDDGDVLSIRLEHGDHGAASLPAGIEPGYYTLEAGSIQANLAIAPPRCFSVSELTGKPKNFGLAAQIYSLRTEGDGGIGNFTGLKEFAVASAREGAQALAMSPVHALFSADETRYSPYAPSSRLFLNALYIDPAAVMGRDLVSSCVSELGIRKELEELERSPLINWPKAARAKLALLRCLWAERGDALMAGEGTLGRSYTHFCKVNGAALEQHSVFEAIHAEQFAANPEHWHWRTWPGQLQNPNNSAVKRYAAEHRKEVGFHSFLQWLAADGLADAQKAGRDAGMGVGLIADLAIGTDSGGSHAWSRQTEMLNGLSVGAPPDLINHRGQDWGLTSFSPRALKAHDYQPFLEMLRASLKYAGGLRIDHVLGLRRLWLVPQDASPVDGAYLGFPQRDLLNLIALESWRHKAVIVGEDLGTVPEGFRNDISEVGVLGMQVLWFEKEHGLFTDPSRWRTDAMATTTTHDLPTVAGWWHARDVEWNQKLDRFEEGVTVDRALEIRAHERQVLWDAFAHAGVAGPEQPPMSDAVKAVDSAIDFVVSSPSPLALVPVEDILGLDEQPNLPGTVDEHPNWRRRLPEQVGDLLRNADAERRLKSLRDKTK